MPSSSSTTTTTTTTLSTYSSPSAAFDSILRRRSQKKMSITQTYYLAHTARRKLTVEAGRADHDLRLLVGHANLLDSLMLELADAEHEQERWFNQTVKTTSTTTTPTTTIAAAESPKHIKWAETVIDSSEEWNLDGDLSDCESDSDSDSDYYEDDEEEVEEDDEEDFFPQQQQQVQLPRRRAPSPVAIITSHELDDYDDSDSDFEYADDDEEDLAELTLTRTSSHAMTSPPPELSSDSSDESDDELPPSPPQPALEAFPATHHSASVCTKEAVTSSTGVALLDSFDEEFYVSRTGQGIISAY
ncbi:hypothetical protein ASPZODRAFT_132633 [Penicilliopsis zonata CBS 506.65]|uniref:Uncharacterized protein n=1 Tax=Penicilliopsis zonata CBS 506.65 TaxID=1073090 RepID=A0A1L9SH98_9EURO|nr:hypothetical protein ASPZODRAFT_132633 [Penicilliopsis zonata CBS 506.65]OJJ46565.1 hypothetical protein ASPZODRAFT_132633 [Penicilliopsis zonata CBS 506.65]